jgi:DNA-directed RNA polymerase subunit beta
LLRRLAEVYDRIEIDPSPIRNKINEIIGSFKKKFDDLQMQYDEEVERAESGEGVESGVIKSVKVYIASKRKLSVGDKMAGRHGNKGVVAKIVPEEDMPFLADGTPVDIVLNPLGVPSRMNVGQVLETHLGWAAKPGMKLPRRCLTASRKQIRSYLEEAGKQQMPGSDPCRRTARRIFTMGARSFDQDRSLHLHAEATWSPTRSTPARRTYSLVTQQPLGGKAQYGGQRFGEMEVWALEAYGAAYTLQELLTVKSDDVQGRTRIYESIVKGDNSLEAGIPESFNVLVKEMQSLGLDVKVGYTNPIEQPADAVSAAAALASA